MVPKDEVRAGLLTVRNTIEADGHLRVSLAGELDLANASTAEAALREALEGGAERVVADMRELTFIDSTGIALLVLLMREDSDRDRLRFLPSEAPGVARVLGVCGVEEHLPLFDGAGHPGSSSVGAGVGAVAESPVAG